ncbi:MAG: anthranilate synthase component I family protein [Leptospiraceae bacterium]|nr:anthranilate synthase component I family protein [Leptospiraceae bacterium]MDW7975564.1 anthranilate synthase component I family protein [Leptospiraceae bacterium]
MKLPDIQIPQKPEILPLEHDIDFLGLFEKIDSEFSYCFFLESLGDRTPHSRYSVIGFDPEAVIVGERHLLRWIKSNERIEIETKNPYDYLASWFPKNKISKTYSGGLVGYLGYDATVYFEPKLSLKPHPNFPLFMFGLYLDGLVHDTYTGETFYFFYKENRIKEILELIKKPAPHHSLKVRFLQQSVTQEKHREMVLLTKEEIYKGNTFQCQIGFQKNYEVQSNSLIPFYKQLRIINPSPHMFYLKFRDKYIVGASPELIFRLRNGEMETFPLAGTIHRGKTYEEDIQLARKLLNDPKEIAEHNMLVDLHRNDLGRVAKPGTVKVRHLMDIKKFSHVQHISSEVVGLIRNNLTMFDGLASVFPAGTLSGAPKIESMKIIERIEDSPRGPYGGAVGHFGFDGNCTFAIPIRTFFVSGELGFTRASSGIVYDSVPEKEYEEIQRKLSALDKSLEVFTS